MPLCLTLIDSKMAFDLSRNNGNRSLRQRGFSIRMRMVGCAKETLGETRDGFRGDEGAWFWNDEVQRVVREKKSAYKHWQKTRVPEDLAAYRISKRLAKAAVAKAKNTKMDALYQKLDSREGEKFVFCLAKARHRATQDIGVVKSVRNS
ncbi:hypothetical protein V3C99_005138 [Haemonchus contortus]|uniref:Endonuclease-reverse transcriptase HmRTE-e01 n=1 Tax=Haemonchus contortus TaxID=6289 RepID=A0A7I4XVI8_HAECO